MFPNIHYSVCMPRAFCVKASRAVDWLAKNFHCKIYGIQHKINGLHYN